MKNLTLLTPICLILATNSVFAGSAPAQISCINKTISLSVKGTIPADEEELNLVISQKGNKKVMTSENTTTNVIRAFNNQVFTLSINENNGADLILYAIPKTVASKTGNRLIDAKFDAILKTAPKPNIKDPSSYNDYFHNIKMSCEYHYSI